MNHFPVRTVYKFATNRILDAVWVLVYQPMINDEIKIYHYAEMSWFGTLIEGHAPTCELHTTGADRVVRSVTFNSDKLIRLRVFNAYPVFDYLPKTPQQVERIALAAFYAYEERKERA